MTEEIIVKRDIDTVTAEIQALCGIGQRVALQLAIEIGRRLVEAKELLTHGEWGPWLKERVSFSQVTAGRYMRLFEEYGAAQGSLFGAETNCSALNNLSVSNALRLLAVPEEEREAFAEAHDVEHLSSREMDRLMEELKAERDELLEQAEKDAEAVLKAEDAVREAEARAEDAEEKVSDLEDRLRELEERPMEVAVEKPDPAEVQKQVDAAVKEAEKTHKAKQKELQDALTEAQKKQKELQAEVDAQKKAATEAEKKLVEQQAGLVSLETARLEKEVERLRKELAMSDAAVAAFRTLFDQAQGTLSRMIEQLGKVTDGETRDKLRQGTKKLLEVYGEKVAGDGQAE